MKLRLRQVRPLRFQAAAVAVQVVVMRTAVTTAERKAQSIPGIGIESQVKVKTIDVHKIEMKNLEDAVDRNHDLVLQSIEELTRNEIIVEGINERTYFLG